ncbi:MAG: hypothetical protein ABI723_12450 [Bacteroidia bacterium]
MFRNLIVVLSVALFECRFTYAQSVNYNFDNLEIAENFESGSSHWTIISNSDNLFLIQNGEYLLNRKSLVSPFAIISGIELPHNNYKLITSLNLQKTEDDKGSIGLLFALQQDKRGGYLLEINKSSQYRIRQLAGSDYLYLTGSEKNSGWVKSETVFSSGTANIIELRTADQNFDLYINSQFIKSISNKIYTEGNFGFVIGPGSKGSIDFVHIYTRNEQPGAVKPKGDDGDVAALAQSIITLKTEVNKLKDENEMLRKTINAVKSETKTNDIDKQKLQEQLTQQQNDYNVLLGINDSLIKSNAELSKYKELIEENNNGDLVINLSKTLKAEKEKSVALQLANDKLQKELNAITQQDKTTTPQHNEQKKTDDFNLPK